MADATQLESKEPVDNVQEEKIDPDAPGTPTVGECYEMTHDEYHLATLGYKQTFMRGLGIFENWAAVFTTMNYTSNMPGLWAFALLTGGPAAALSNWIMVGGLASIVSLSMAEIAAAMPTAGGIYYWSFKLGGPKWGPFLAWMTAWWNWLGWITIVPGVAQIGTNFLLSALEIQYPDSTIIGRNWMPWLVTSLSIAVCVFTPNVWSQGTLRFMLRSTILTFLVLFFMFWIWLPVEVAQHGKFQDASFLRMTYSGISSTGTPASEAYCWVVSVLFGAWVFYGYDAAVHLSEETKGASMVVARGMWIGTVASWLLSVPTVIIMLLCIQDFDGIVGGTYTNNFAMYLFQILGKKGTVTVLVFCWLDAMLNTAVCFMSAQRVTYAIARDGILPGSKWIRKLSANHMPVNAAWVVLFCAVAIEAAIIGSTVAFYALTATATISTNLSYLVPIVARHTIGRDYFTPAKWNLGKFSPIIGTITALYILFQFVVLMLPQVFPVTAQTLNYAPIMIGGITLIALVSWFFPKIGGMYWFQGPQRTISEEEVRQARVVGLKEV